MSQKRVTLEDHKDVILKWADEGVAGTEIQKRLIVQKDFLTTDRSVRRALQRWTGTGARRDTEGEQSLTSDAVSELPSALELLTERGFDPDEWEVKDASITEWGTPEEPMKRLKIDIRRIKSLELVVPAREETAYVRPKPFDYSPTWVEPELVVLVGDQQAPYHNTHLHKMFCHWLSWNRPHRGVLIGDTMDFPKISRHADNPEWAATTQQCIDSAYGILRDYVVSSDDTVWQKLAGNHDERIRRQIIDRIPDLYDLRRADKEGVSQESILDIPHLLWLDELKIDYIKPNGSYEHAQVKLSPLLAARHGWIATKGSGSSALKTLEHLGYSCVVGHTHRQGLVHHTKHTIDGLVHTLAAVEAGCMCRIEEGLGYAVAPDWQNGFATACVWPDGTFKLDLATYVDGALYWRNQRYS